MSQKISANTRIALREGIRKLPQAHLLDDNKINAWIEQVLSVEPERADWHVKRLAGIGGSEIGVLWGSDRGMYHPFSSAYDVVASKLLDKGISEPNGPMKLGTALENMTRDMARAKMVSTYGARDDLVAKIGGARFDDVPWLIGNPDDIFDTYKKDGAIYVVDYKVPQPETFKHVMRSGIPFYYEAQMHHYALIAEKSGYKIGGLMLAMLDLNQFDVKFLSTPYNPQMAQEIIEVGNKYWNEYVLRARNAPSAKLTNSIDMEEIDKDGSVLKAAKQFAFYRHAALATKKESDEIADSFSFDLPALSPEIDRIRSDNVTLKIERDYDVVKLEAKLREIAGSSTTQGYVDTWLQAKATMPATLDNEKVVEYMRNELHIAPEEVWPDTVLSPPSIRADVVVSMIRLLDVKKEVNWADYIVRQIVKPELSRQKEVMAAADELRTALVKNLGQWQFTPEAESYGVGRVANDVPAVEIMEKPTPAPGLAVGFRAMAAEAATQKIATDTGAQAEIVSTPAPVRRRRP